MPWQPKSRRPSSLEKRLEERRERLARLVKRLAARGWHATKICKRLKISPVHFRRIVKEHEIKVPVFRHTQPLAPIVEELLRLASKENLLTFNEMASLSGMKAGFVRKHCAKIRTPEEISKIAMLSMACSIEKRRLIRDDLRATFEGGVKADIRNAYLAISRQREVPFRAVRWVDELLNISDKNVVARNERLHLFGIHTPEEKRRILDENSRLLWKMARELRKAYRRYSVEELFSRVWEASLHYLNDWDKKRGELSTFLHSRTLPSLKSVFAKEARAGRIFIAEEPSALERIAAAKPTFEAELLERLSVEKRLKAVAALPISERNKLIFKLRLQGMPLADIGAEPRVRLSAQMVSRILQEIKEMLRSSKQGRKS